MSQKDTNPYPLSDSHKRYQTYDYWLRRVFGGKCAKIPLDGGFTCPNADGMCGVGGCIYCSDRGSGDFASPAELSLRVQYDTQRAKLSGKWSTERCIAYFQARTNTYAPVEILREKFEEALTFDGVVGMNIATRADCLPPDTVDYLADLANRTTLTVELGLQTIHDQIAKRINRGHTFSDFVDGYTRLTQASPKINTCIHLILGLPGEDLPMMLDSIRAVAKLRPTMVKLHLLHVLKETVLGDMYEQGNYIPMTREDYVHTVVRCLELLPPETVVARLTGDGNAKALLAPLWSIKKMAVINEIDKLLYQENTWQGKLYKA
ncbi:MAG: TIGR01212 family radical SAM protein [Ruminococcaceae bacterium]|nr:TIGR01212 family radical SAM protein [Oscillospiraceae bacterium]